MACNRLLSFGLVVLLAAPASAQHVWLSPDPGRNVELDVAKGFFRSGSGIGFASFIVTAEGRFPVSPNLAITAALPYATISESDAFNGSSTSTGVGNPWLGVEISPQQDFAIEAGIRPGIASDAVAHEEAYFLGVFDDFNRLEAWLPKQTSVRGMAHLGRIPERGTFVTGILGGTLLLAGNGAESQIDANYGLRLGVRDDHTLTSLTLTGRAELGHSLAGGSLDRTEHQVAILVEGTRGAFRPNFSVGTFTRSNLRDEIKAIVTVGASFVF
ncbi:MAG: hypothetical protein ACRELE_07185 [Gemmatimonadales bacterium]